MLQLSFRASHTVLFISIEHRPFFTFNFSLQAANFIFLYFAASILKNQIMEYSKLISVTGLGGLFELVASKTDGAIIRII